MKITARHFLILVIFILAALLVFAANAGNLLVVDAPQPADVIVVLAGETNRRPAYALGLLDQGYAHRMLIDVPGAARIYGFTEVQLVENYVHTLPEAASIAICPVQGLSTKDESHDVARCLAHEQAFRILIVTSEFHTRRSLSIFRHELRNRSFSIAAARDDTQFGTHWWTHRQWAKTCVDEWLRMVWWNVVERWE